MTKMTYGEQLKHPNWQRKRLEVLERAKWMCEGCQGNEVTLHVHHKHYVKGRMAWEYEHSELEALCETCHEAAHEDRAAFNALLASLRKDGPYSVGMAYSLVAGWASRSASEALIEPLNRFRYSFAIGLVADQLDDSDLDLDELRWLAGCLIERTPELKEIIRRWRSESLDISSAASSAPKE